MGIDDFYESPNLVKCFPPIIDEHSEILILGSAPGHLSLARREYYSNPTNHFWALIRMLYHDDQPFKSYEDKVACLKRSHIALWDVLHTCWRKGSKDANIRNPESNDIGRLLRKYPNIKKIVLNGTNAEKYFYSSYPLSIPVLTAPSTSAGNDVIKDKRFRHYIFNWAFFEWEKCLEE